METIPNGWNMGICLTEWEVKNRMNSRMYRNLLDWMGKKGDVPLHFSVGGNGDKRLPGMRHHIFKFKMVPTSHHFGLVNHFDCWETMQWLSCSSPGTSTPLRRGRRARTQGEEGLGGKTLLTWFLVDVLELPLQWLEGHAGGHPCCFGAFGAWTVAGGRHEGGLGAAQRSHFLQLEEPERCGDAVPGRTDPFGWQDERKPWRNSASSGWTWCTNEVLESIPLKGISTGDPKHLRGVSKQGLVVLGRRWVYQSSTDACVLHSRRSQESCSKASESHVPSRNGQPHFLHCWGILSSWLRRVASHAFRDDFEINYGRWPLWQPGGSLAQASSNAPVITGLGSAGRSTLLVLVSDKGPNFQVFKAGVPPVYWRSFDQRFSALASLGQLWSIVFKRQVWNPELFMSMTQGPCDICSAQF